MHIVLEIHGSLAETPSKREDPPRTRKVYLYRTQTPSDSTGQRMDTAVPGRKSIQGRHGKV